MPPDLVDRVRAGRAEFRLLETDPLPLHMSGAKPTRCGERRRAQKKMPTMHH